MTLSVVWYEMGGVVKKESIDFFVKECGTGHSEQVEKRDPGKYHGTEREAVVI